MPFPGGSDFKKNTCNAGDRGPIPKLEGSPGEGNGNPLQHSCLENPTHRTAWQVTVHGVTKESDTAEHLNNSSSKGPLCSQLDSLLAHSLEFGWVPWLPSCSHSLQVTTVFDPTSSTSADSAISFLRNSLSSLICRSLPSYMLLLAFY